MDAILTPGRRLIHMALACGVAAFLAGAWLTASADSTVYKWIDTQGRIHYSDRPPPADGRLLAIETAPSAHSHVATIDRPSASSAGPAPSSAVKPSAAAGAASPQLKAAVANDVASARVEQCKQAQDKYQGYIRSRRLFREGPDKEHVFLTDAEIETERLNAKREADEACQGVEPP
jgi:hypothetical protein